MGEERKVEKKRSIMSGFIGINASHVDRKTDAAVSGLEPGGTVLGPAYNLLLVRLHSVAEVVCAEATSIIICKTYFFLYFGSLFTRFLTDINNLEPTFLSYSACSP